MKLGDTVRWRDHPARAIIVNSLRQKWREIFTASWWNACKSCSRVVSF